MVQNGPENEWFDFEKQAKNSAQTFDLEWLTWKLILQENPVHKVIIDGQKPKTLLQIA